jgi:hypothetical protein
MRPILLVAGLLFCASVGFGQTALATVTGTITDSTGAVVANAPVSLKNLENGQIYTASSSATGNYTVSQLAIGDYDLTVAVPGFKTYAHNQFHLAANQIMREDVALQVGQASESVTVTAEASLLKTENSELAQNVTLSQLNNLPILIVGATGEGIRDPFQAVRLVPGIRYNAGANIGSGGAPAVVTTMVVNGTPANTYGTRLDGMTMNPTSPRLLGAQMQTQPSVDSLEEVAIQTSNFAAEFGAAGGAMVNMVTKSGTNTFHGGAYDYATNEALNAHQPYLGTRNKVHQHDWGFTFGGPVRIPKLYNGTNKTFFFWSYEQFDQKGAVVSNVSVPTQAYRGGDFSNLITAENRLVTTATGPALDALGRQIQSGAIFDPNTQNVAANGKAYRDPFSSNSIPLNRFDPISVKVLALIPAPLGVNFAKGLVSNNYTGTYNTSRRSKIPSIKVDQNLGTKGHVSFYFQRTNTSTPRTTAGADPFPDLITTGATSDSSGRTIRLNYDYTATSRLLFHVGVGWNDSFFQLEAPVSNFDAFKVLGLSGQNEARYFPRVTAGVNANDQIGGLSSLGTNFPTLNLERRPTGTVSANYVKGGHTFKLGAEYRIEKFPSYVRTSGLGNTSTNTTGTYNFDANWTQQPSLQGIQTNQGFQGFQFASFLLGGVSGNSSVAVTGLSTSKSQTGLYFQDTWKITRKLTLDYGLRWDYGTYAKEQYGRNGSVGLAIPNPSASGRLGGTQFEAICKCNFAGNYPYALGPRLGVAYQIDRKTVLRAGWGVVYNSTSTASGSTSAYASSTTFPTNSGQITGLFKDGMPASVHAVWPSFDPASGQGVGSVIPMPSLLDVNAGRPARLVQWNIGLQREINRNLVVEASYVGNRGVWWTQNALGTLNALSQDTLRAYGFNDFTSATEAALLTTNVGNLTTTQKATLAARGITGLPYANFPNTQSVRQSLLAYPQFTGSGLSGAPLGNTWYDSFQLSVTQRFNHGLSFNMNYTFAKSLDTLATTPPDVFNRQLSKNLGTFDQPHQIRLTAQYQVPELKNSGMRFVSNNVTSYVLSGWGIGAYVTYQSAALLSKPSSNGTTPLSQFLGRGPGSAQLKRNPDGSYMNPWSIDWFDNDGKHHTDPLDINCHCFDPTKTVALNPNAWENIPNGVWGDDQGSYRFFRGIRLPTENANISRNFRFGKEGRFNLNIRAEFNNMFNRTQLPAPTSVAAPGQPAINFASIPTKFTTGANTGLYSGGFGTFGVLSGTSGQRTGSLVGRFTF